ncbi:MAG TPA: TIR domain-containing protein, partial [Ktedonobacteraceae bacterium]|nr:TIR domain-containing protein [Ktedonobacteraceae bacterium]
MPATPTKEIKLFYCYAREDRSLRDELEVHLGALKRQYHLNNWHDREILPGQNWESAINEQLDTADIVLLLISPNFMDSEYCYGKEMSRALERHEAGTCCVIPILLRPTYWEDAPFNSIELLPTDAIPITRWPDRDEGFRTVVSGISRSIKELLAQKSKERWVEEGVALFKANRLSDALAAYAKALKRDPHYAPAHFRRGDTLARLNNFTDALAAFEETIRLDPSFIEAYVGKGESFERLNQPR